MRACGSRNGTRVRDGASHEITLVGLRNAEDCETEENSKRIYPGDEIMLGDSTIFLVLEGIRG